MEVFTKEEEEEEEGEEDSIGFDRRSTAGS
jgi:hypothetical protein